MSKRAFFLSLLAVFASVSLFTSSNTSASGNSVARTITFSKDVAPIFYKACVECHRAGDFAPMSLITYKEARPWARSIREKVVSGEMPPWPADPKHGEFSNQRKLTPREVETITKWVDQGAPEGNPKDLPPTPQFAEGWRIGKPDVVLTMPQEFNLAAEGPDEYQYFQIPTNFKEDVWIQAAEARAGNKRIVHHIIAFVQPPRPPAPKKSTESRGPNVFEEAFKKAIIFYEDGRLIRVKSDVPVFDNGCATSEGGAGIFRDGSGKDGQMNFLCGLSPGRDADSWPLGLAKKVPAGSSIVLQVHYSRSGKAEKDRSSIGLIFAKQPPNQSVSTRAIVNYYFQIPPGADNHEVTGCYTVNEPVHLLSLMPHMHVRGKDMTVRAFYPDGRSETLLSVPRYSFSWQTNYYFKRAVAIPKGTRLEVTAHFDNSPKNKHNPDASKAVRFGDPTYDEMMMAFLDFTVDGERLGKTDPAVSTSSK
jgi:hypothetical protein